jgi:DNA-binding beta-propeller fold protein YncE
MVYPSRDGYRAVTVRERKSTSEILAVVPRLISVAGSTGANMSMKLLLVFCAIAMAAWAGSSASVGGPVTGFVFDSQTLAIRPMLGIPGAAYIGTPVASQVAAASVSPNGSAAFAIQLGHLVLYTGLRSASPATVTIDGAIAGVDHFAWAADGTTAAVYSSKSLQAQILTNLAQTPAAGALIDLSGISGTVAALAFDGQRIIAGATSTDSGGIYVAGAQTALERIAPASSPSAIALAGANLYFADHQSQQIWEVESYAKTPAAVLFAADSGISAPVGLQLSADGQRLYAANAGNQKLAIYDVASRSPLQSIDLDFAPTGLDRFGASSVYLLSSSGPGPLHVLSDGNTAKIAVYFVPAPDNAGKPKLLFHPI